MPQDLASGRGVGLRWGGADGEERAAAGREELGGSPGELATWRRASRGRSSRRGRQRSSVSCAPRRIPGARAVDEHAVERSGERRPRRVLHQEGGAHAEPPRPRRWRGRGRRSTDVSHHERTARTHRARERGRLSTGSCARVEDANPRAAPQARSARRKADAASWTSEPSLVEAGKRRGEDAPSSDSVSGGRWGSFPIPAASNGFKHPQPTFGIRSRAPRAGGGGQGLGRALDIISHPAQLAHRLHAGETGAEPRGSRRGRPRGTLWVRHAAAPHSRTRGSRPHATNRLRHRGRARDLLVNRSSVRETGARERGVLGLPVEPQAEQWGRSA